MINRDHNGDRHKHTTFHGISPDNTSLSPQPQLEPRISPITANGKRQRRTGALFFLYMFAKRAAPPKRAPMAAAAVGTGAALVPVSWLVALLLAEAPLLLAAVLADPSSELRLAAAEPVADVSAELMDEPSDDSFEAMLDTSDDRTELMDEPSLAAELAADAAEEAALAAALAAEEVESAACIYTKRYD